MPNPVINRRVLFSPSLGATGYTPSAECQAWLNRINAATGSIPSESFIGTIDTYIFKTLVSSGAFPYLDRLWVGAQEVEAHGLYSLVNPASTPMTLVNSPSWTQYQGWSGNGSTMYIDTNYNTKTDGVNYALNDACHGLYCRSTFADTSIEMGNSDTVNTSYLIPRYSGNVTYGKINNAIADNINIGNTDSSGLYTLRRTASNAEALYKNGSQTKTDTDVSTDRANANMYVLGFNNNGSLLSPTSKQLSIFFIGSGSINQSDLSNTLNGFMTQLGTNVY